MDKTPWEWTDTNWHTFSEKNQTILNARALEPSLTPLCLIEGDAILKGCPETSQFRYMSLTLDGKTTTTSIRRARADNDIPFFATVTEQGAVPLPYDIGQALFEARDGHWTPRQQKTVQTLGTRTLIADEGRLYEVYGPGIRELVWREKDITRDEFDWATRTRAQWECKTPFRWERMRKAVHAINDPLLLHAMDNFSPQWPIHATKHGPIQFQDFIREMWTHETDMERRKQIGKALTRLETTYDSMCQEPGNWVDIDPVLNALIERARQEGRLDFTFSVQSQHYMILFDTGGGAFKSPILLRPTRYRQILQSIEDDVIEQLYMPTLLQKYEECPIRRVLKNHPPTRLDRHVAATLTTGFRVPSNIHATFPELIQFIDRHQSTQFSNVERSTCVLCQQQAPLLGGHCGTATACLTCWCATLKARAQKCAFCNQTVFEGQLKLCQTPPPLTPPKIQTITCKASHKNKTSDEIRQHLQTHSPAFDIDIAHRMEQWYRKMLHCNLISIHQRPTHPRKKKTFHDALKEFHLL